MRFFSVICAGLACTLSVAGCTRETTREYTLRGQVLSIADDRLQANIKHEEIPGFMPAMTMPYKVHEARDLEGVEPGDLISARLVVMSNDGYLTDVRRVGSAPIEEARPAAPGASSGFELLKPGEKLPDVAFLDQDGKARDFSSFRGSTLVLTFIYTRCPMPTFCPLMDRHFATLQDEIKGDPALENVHLVTISFDPATDTPAVLKAHASTLGADPARWTFLTGDRDEIDRFAARFGVSLVRETTDPLDITHNLRTAVVDAEGALVTTYTGNSWTPEEVLADLRKAVGKA